MKYYESTPPDGILYHHDHDERLNADIGTRHQRSPPHYDGYFERTARCAVDGLIHKISRPPRQLVPRSSPSPLLGPNHTPKTTYQPSIQ